MFRTWMNYWPVDRCWYKLSLEVALIRFRWITRFVVFSDILLQFGNKEHIVTSPQFTCRGSILFFYSSIIMYIWIWITLVESSVYVFLFEEPFNEIESCTFSESVIPSPRTDVCFPVLLFLVSPTFIMWLFDCPLTHPSEMTIKI